jgi:PQQ-dependent catabolism-associated CXXCW motif protein
MRPLLPLIAGMALVLALAQGPAGAAEPPAPPQPEGYWTGPAHGRTPAGLTGAAVLGASALGRLIEEERPLLLDVAAADQKPPGMPDDRPWRPIHRSIPGSVWMPGAGAGRLDPADEDRLRTRVAALVGARRDRPIVTFCHRDCWASWNAAKRLVQQGYTRIFWFPGGVEGWQDSYDTAVVEQDPAWAGRP